MRTWTTTQSGGRRAARSFTLLEVMIASAILALAVVMTASILGGARARILRAEKRWGRQHILSQAAELYLLGGPGAEMPAGLLPEGFSAQCEVFPVEEGLDEESSEPVDGWILGEYHIRVFDTYGNLMDECRVQKVIREDDVQ